MFFLFCITSFQSNQNKIVFVSLLSIFVYWFSSFYQLKKKNIKKSFDKCYFRHLHDIVLFVTVIRFWWRFLCLWSILLQVFVCACKCEFFVFSFKFTIFSVEFFFVFIFLIFLPLTQEYWPVFRLVVFLNYQRSDYSLSSPVEIADRWWFVELYLTC